LFIAQRIAQVISIGKRPAASLVLLLGAALIVLWIAGSETIFTTNDFPMFVGAMALLLAQ